MSTDLEVSASALSAPATPHAFCEQLHILLTEIREAFPEDEQLQLWVNSFISTVRDKAAMEESVIQRWHEDMSKSYDDGATLYSALERGDVAPLFVPSRVNVLTKISMAARFAELVDEDQEAVVLKLRALAQVSTAHFSATATEVRVNPIELIPRMFVTLVELFLTWLKSAVPTCALFSAWLEEFEAFTAVPENALAALELWHREAAFCADGTPRDPDVYDLVEAQDIDGLLDADISFVEELNDTGAFAADLYNAETFDRAKLFTHLSRINTVVFMFKNMPMDMLDMITELIGPMDMAAGLDKEKMQGLFQRLIGKATAASKQADMPEKILRWATQMGKIAKYPTGTKALIEIFDDDMYAAVGLSSQRELVQMFLSQASSIPAIASIAGSSQFADILNRFK